MSQADSIKKLMRLYGITYAELGEELNRSPATVKQRLNTKSTFHKHFNEYKRALERCIEKQNKKRQQELEKIGG